MSSLSGCVFLGDSCYLALVLTVNQDKDKERFVERAANKYTRPEVNFTSASDDWRPRCGRDGR